MSATDDTSAGSCGGPAMQRSSAPAVMLLIVCLVTLGLAACGGGDSNGTTDAPSQGSGSQATSTQAPAEGGMPSVIGKTIGQAESTLDPVLNSYNLKFSYEKSGEKPGTVIDQSPAPGSPLTPGKVYTVKITVSE
ncbi:MAG: PASTA domain-containing protein [Actinomycetota bacterium]